MLQRFLDPATTVERILPVHCAQLLTYLKLSGKQVGLLLNFNETVLKRGLKRFVNRFAGPEEGGRSSALSALEPQAGNAALQTRSTPLKTRRLGVSAVK